MATITPEERTTTRIPEVLTEEHHEALKASWELPAHVREAPQPAPRAHRSLFVGLLAGAVGLAVGFGAGYWAHGQTQTVPAAAPIVISRLAGPVDANGMTLGRRVAPFETWDPTALPGARFTLPGVSGGRP